MGNTPGKQKNGKADCNFTGDIKSIDISAMDYPCDIGIVQINCDNLACKSIDCYYKHHDLIGSTKNYLNLKSIVWTN
jgi:hypothetical protein